MQCSSLRSSDAVWQRLTPTQRCTVLEAAMLAHDLGQCALSIGCTGGAKVTKKIASSARGMRVLKAMWPLAPILEQAGYRNDHPTGDTDHE